MPAADNMLCKDPHNYELLAFLYTQLKWGQFDKKNATKPLQTALFKSQYS